MSKIELEKFMLVDSHCHLNFPDFQGKLPEYLEAMQQNQVVAALCVSTTPENIPKVIALANMYPNLFASVGVHPDEKLDEASESKLTKEFLLEYAKHPKVIAIGETGLDYYHNKIESDINNKISDHVVDMSWQHERFILHIEVAKIVQLPLIVHTRNSVADTLHIMKEYNASNCGAVMHCFTESLEYAKKFLDLGFYISISGIVTFKNAAMVQEVARYIPLDRLLIETDAPFLAPVPYRGKLNHPALVKHTAQYIADLKQLSLEELGRATTDNFFKLFKSAVKN